MYQSASSGIKTLASGNAYDIGYRAGQNTGAAAEVVALAGATTGASKIASKAMPKVIDSKLFSANDGYGLKIGKTSKVVNGRTTGRIEILYRYSNVKQGGTFVSFNNSKGISKFRIDWDPAHGFHSHPPGH